jgi:hypothetical protein
LEAIHLLQATSGVAQHCDPPWRAMGSRQFLPCDEYPSHPRWDRDLTGADRKVRSGTSTLAHPHGPAVEVGMRAGFGTRDRARDQGPLRTELKPGSIDLH